MSWIQRYTMTEKNAGRKQEEKAKSEQSYSIYDSAYNCPLRVYIAVVCDKDYQSLVKSGNVSHEALETAFCKIMDEYSDLSGSKNQQLQTYYNYRAQIVALEVCLNLLSLGEVDRVIEALNKIGLRCEKPTNDEELKTLAEKIDFRLKDRTLRMKKVSKEIEGAKKKELTKRDFYEQLVSISQWAGFRLSDEITLAEYALYVKKAHEYSEQMKMKLDGKK